MEQENTGQILLTSIGLSCEKASNFVRDFSSETPQVVSIVVTASEGKKENKYVQLAIKQFDELGMNNINLVDLESGETVPDATTILYVSGGNTFTLMHFARQSDFNKSIKNLLDRNGLYVGVSAGSIILGNSVEGAAIEGDENVIGMTDYTGFNIVDYSIFPHSDESIEAKAMDAGIYKNPLFITNDQAFLVEIKDKEILNSQFI